MSGKLGRVYKDGLFYYFSYRQERKRRGGGKAESTTRTTGDGGAGWSGAEGEGLTAINFAKIGAYAVAGRQSNPSSARYPPYVEMGVRLDVGSSREEKRRNSMVAMLAEVAVRSFCNYLPGSQDSFSFSAAASLPLFPPISIYAKFADSDRSPLLGRL